MKFEENYFDFRREPWQISYENEPRNIEYILGEVFYKGNRRVGWIDRTGFIDDNDQANYLITCLRREFRGEFFEAGVKVLIPEVNQRRFVISIVMILDSLQKGRFESYFADYLGCPRDKAASFALCS